MESRFNRFELDLLVLRNRLDKLENNKRACARATVAEGLPLSLIVNKTASFSVLVQDCGGYDLSTGGDNVTATLTCVDYPSLVSPQPTVVDNGDGSYQVSLSPECSGNNLVSVSINGKTIKDMPVTVAVILPYTSLRLKQLHIHLLLTLQKMEMCLLEVGLTIMSITLTEVERSSTVGDYQETRSMAFWCMVTM